MRVILDTNVLIAALVSRSKGRAPGRLVQQAIQGGLPLLASAELLAEYSRSLRKATVARRHHLSESELEALLSLVGLRAQQVRAPQATAICPDPKDAHLWALLEADPEAVLVTGERALLESEDFPGRVLTPRSMLERLGLLN